MLTDNISTTHICLRYMRPWSLTHIHLLQLFDVTCYNLPIYTYTLIPIALFSFYTVVFLNILYIEMVSRLFALLLMFCYYKWTLNCNSIGQLKMTKMKKKKWEKTNHIPYHIITMSWMSPLSGQTMCSHLLQHIHTRAYTHTQYSNQL